MMRTTKEKLLASGGSLTLEEACLAVYLHGWQNGYRKATGKNPPRNLLDKIANQKTKRLERIRSIDGKVREEELDE